MCGRAKKHLKTVKINKHKKIVCGQIKDEPETKTKPHICQHESKNIYGYSDFIRQTQITCEKYVAGGKQKRNL